MINNGNELVDAFGISSSEVYLDPIILHDVRAGFSVKRNYPNNIRFSPPKTRTGEDDVVAIFHVVCEETDKSENRIPIYIRTQTFSKYRANHFDYNYDDVDCPTEASLINSKKTPEPISIESTDEYYIDINNNRFIRENGNSISGKEILDTLFDEHIKIVHPIRGLNIRSKLTIQSKLFELLRYLIELLKSINYWIFGITIESENEFVSLTDGYKAKDMKLLKTDYINLLGYKASRRSVVIFCFGVITVFSVGYFLDLECRYLSLIANNNVLSICAIIIVMGIIEQILPRILLGIINVLIRTRWRVGKMKFKV